MDFKIDFGSLPLSQARTQEEPLWAAIDGRATPLAGDEAVFFDPIHQRSHVMTHQVLQALDLCRPFRPLSAHIEAVADGLPGLKGKQAAVRPVLESLQSRGLLQSDDAWRKRMADAVPRAHAPIGGLFVRACNRPQQLAALLTTLASRAQALAVCERLVVIDDSTDPAALAAHGQQLEAFAAHWPHPVHHLTPALWRELVTELGNELPEHAHALAEVLLSARGSGNGGSARNLATLIAAGTRYLLLDDDNLLPLARLDATSVAFDPQPASTVVRSFADHEQAVAHGVADEAAIAWHLDVCGRALGEVLALGGSVGVNQAQLRNFVPSWRADLRPHARIALTVSGHRGGSTMASPQWLLGLDAAARAGLCASDASWLAGRADPSVWVGFERVYATRMATVSPFAIDNSQLMPCTLPRGRGEDLIYLALVAAADGESLQLLMPTSAGHRPEAGRDRSAYFERPSAVSLTGCIGDYIAGMADGLHAANPATRLACVAAKLSDLAGASSAARQAYLREFEVMERSALLRRLQDAMPAAQTAPALFREDIRRQLELNARAVVERGPLRMADIAPNASSEDCAAALGRDLDTLAGGLRAWPQAWAIALQRREDWLARARVGG